MWLSCCFLLLVEDFLCSLSLIDFNLIIHTSNSASCNINSNHSMRQKATGYFQLSFIKSIWMNIDRLTNKFVKWSKELSTWGVKSCLIWFGSDSCWGLGWPTGACLICSPFLSVVFENFHLNSVHKEGNHIRKDIIFRKENLVNTRSNWCKDVTCKRVIKTLHSRSP